MEAVLRSCGKEDLLPSIAALGLNSVEDLALCEPSDFEADLGVDRATAALLVQKAQQAQEFETHKSHVQSTWKAVEGSLNVRAAKLFYQHLFDAYPDVAPLFENADMDAQAEKLYKTVGIAVKYLDDVDGLVPVLQEMGEKHKREWGCTRKQYTAVGEALVWTLKIGLGELWTPDVADAWAYVYNIIATTMADAGDNLKSDGRRSIRTLTEAEKKRYIRETWAQIEPMREHATKLFYRDLRETDPKANGLFTGVDMESQEKKLADTLGVAVKHLDDLDGLIPVLEDMAVRHVDFGVTAEMYDTVGASLLKTLGIGLGDDWTPEVKESWTWVYTLMRDVMVKKAYPSKV